MEINREYRRFVMDIINRNKYRNSGLHFLFENIDVYLSPREFYIVCFSMAKHRPTNRALTKTLFDFIRGYTSIETPEFIVSWCRQNYMSLNFSTKCEEIDYRRSIATSGPNNPSYKGTIYAVNIETDEITPMNSRSDMRSLGFLPSGVYECVNGNNYTHKGHVFIRETDIKRPRKFQRKRMGIT